MFDISSETSALNKDPLMDLMSELRQSNPDLRGIALTGYGMEQDVRKSVEAGFDVHLTKPPDLNRLEALLTGDAGADPRS